MISPLQPLIKWSGGKGDEIKNIIPYIPPSYETYIEPFFGGGALYFNLCPKNAVLNDIHKELISFYKEIQAGNGEKIYNFMNKNLNNETTYYKVRDKMETTTRLEIAQKFYYLRKTCYRGMLRYNSKGGFNIPFGKYKTINYEQLKDKRYETLLKGANITNEDFTNIFKQYNSSDNFMFLDPPYDSVFTDYGYCSFGKKEHIKLFNCFQNTQNNCLMVIGKTPFIQDLYEDYIDTSYEKRYRFRLHSNRIGNDINADHFIITNYEVIDE